MRLLLVEETGDADAVVQEWDWRYLDGRQRARAGSDPDALRDYLPFEACLDAVASLGESVFGVRLEPRPERPRGTRTCGRSTSSTATPAA